MMARYGKFINRMYSKSDLPEYERALAIRGRAILYNEPIALQSGEIVVFLTGSLDAHIATKSTEFYLAHDETQVVGGIINTRHPGQVSRLYKGLCETVGLLVANPSPGRQIAVVPRTEGTLKLAQRLAPRCALAGIEIALVGSRGEVVDVGPT
jgi:hypothetical protein